MNKFSVLLLATSMLVAGCATPNESDSAGSPDTSYEGVALNRISIGGTVHSVGKSLVRYSSSGGGSMAFYDLEFLADGLSVSSNGSVLNGKGLKLSLSVSINGYYGSGGSLNGSYVGVAINQLGLHSIGSDLYDGVGGRSFPISDYDLQNDSQITVSISGSRMKVQGKVYGGGKLTIVNFDGPMTVTTYP